MLNKTIKIKSKNRKIFLSSGVPSSLLAIIGLLSETEDLFFTHLLPGSIGGAVFMNARCYNNEFCNILDKIYYLDEKYNIKSIDQKKKTIEVKKKIGNCLISSSTINEEIGCLSIKPEFLLKFKILKIFGFGLSIS
ncbi:MAG: hypothetical protein QXN46_01890, partial [Candidatus Woesearchaeota archaeon]